MRGGGRYPEPVVLVLDPLDAWGRSIAKTTGLEDQIVLKFCRARATGKYPLAVVAVPRAVAEGLLAAFPPIGETIRTGGAGSFQVAVVSGAAPRPCG